MLKISQIYQGRLVVQKTDTAKKRFSDRVCRITKVDGFGFSFLPLDSLREEGPFGLYGSKNERSIRWEMRACKKGEAKNFLDYRARKLQLTIDEAIEAKKSPVEIKEARRELRQFVSLKEKIERRRKT